MAISDTNPPKFFKRGGKVVATLNVVTKQVVDPQSSKTHTQYEYDEVEGSTEEEAQKILDSKSELKLASLDNMTYAELDAYIETNITTLASSKVFIKKLAKIVLVLVKQQK